MTNTKITCHIPTEQYGFIEIEIIGKEKEAIERYFLLKDLWGKKKKELEPPPFDIQNPPQNPHLKH